MLEDDWPLQRWTSDCTKSFPLLSIFERYVKTENGKHSILIPFWKFYSFGERNEFFAHTSLLCRMTIFLTYENFALVSFFNHKLLTYSLLQNLGKTWASYWTSIKLFIFHLVLIVVCLSRCAKVIEGYVLCAWRLQQIVSVLLAFLFQILQLNQSCKVLFSFCCDLKLPNYSILLRKKRKQIILHEKYNTWL